MVIFHSYVSLPEGIYCMGIWMEQYNKRDMIFECVSENGGVPERWLLNVANDDQVWNVRVAYVQTHLFLGNFRPWEQTCSEQN